MLNAPWKEVCLFWEGKYYLNLKAQKYSKAGSFEQGFVNNPILQWHNSFIN